MPDRSVTIGVGESLRVGDHVFSILMIDEHTGEVQIEIESLGESGDSNNQESNTVRLPR